MVKVALLLPNCNVCKLSSATNPLITEKATSISEVHEAHAHLLKIGLIHHPSVARRLLFAAAAAATTTATTTYAHSTFTRLQDPNSTVYNAMIRAYANGPTPQNAITVYTQMMNDCVVPDKYTFTSALKGCSRIRGVEEGKQFHAHVVKIGTGSDLIVGNTLVHLYDKCGCFEVAREVLDRMPQRDVISWKAILSAYVSLGLVEALEVFDKMPERNLESWNFMVSGYMGVGLVEEARGVFDEMPVEDVVSWNAMITGSAQVSRFGDVLVLFEEMQNGNVKPDSCTLVICERVICLCSYWSFEPWRVGSCLCQKKNRIDDANGFLATALVDMYSKCGCIEKALEVFQKCVQKKIIQPSVKHYGCMVDLLGRFGLLEEAEELVKSMPVKESPVVWEPLLGACRNHGNVSMAEHIAGKLLELAPEESSGYVQLSNIHAYMGRWNNVNEVRRKMKTRGASKQPGCSMIEVDGIVHESFSRGNSVHS
ncbi:pentatricopeptide repeat (PPR-like) superfamily protein [Actinidia rufa]|uniref:Pentatricopeptide repeat (PPR-like) superfamily protein n=1 Tax=Actinidia rufa TaxID=165716 RepID=A0A7J0G611_9ERIC|nr:pentatricopeptide repeat (PPR-like) superfamily protein [Actinidia rufa]